MTMKLSRTILALAAFAAAACGSSGSTGNGTMSVHLVDGPGDYEHIELDVRQVQIHSADGGWLTLGAPNKVVDLLTLTGGVEETLANGASLPAGSYDQLRLVLGPNNQVTLQDGTTHALTVPSGMQSGVKLNAHFDVAPGTTKDVFIDFDAHRSIFVHPAGASGKYMLRPVVRAVDKIVTGSVSGTLTAAGATPTPLAGVTVMAEVVGANGVATVIRSTKTAADGSYTLDLLPVGGTYYLVSQPVVGATSYEAQASGAIAITAATPVTTWSPSFTPAVAVDVPGTVTPPASADAGQFDTIVVTKAFLDGLVQHALVVRTLPATVTTSGETFTLAALPVGGYQAYVSRVTVALDGSESVQTGGVVDFPVASGSTVPVTLAVP